MSVLLGRDTRVLVQGMGREGTFHATRMREYGTKVVGGVVPGAGGTTREGIPIFDTVSRAEAETGANASIIFVPASGAMDAMLEALDAELGLVIAITEGIPVQDMLKVASVLERSATTLIGPNCPGAISPGKCNVGITAGDIALAPSADRPNVGIVSRSGTLTYQALYELKQNGIGVSTCVGIGGDPVPGTSFVDCLAEFEADPETHAVFMIGEIGGSAEEEAAEFITAHVSKPMAAYIAGVTAPAGKKMGHAGAIVSGGKGTAQGKMDALAAAGVEVGLNPTEASERMARIVSAL
jgi:succinyl-CoA synthetase alpha subunit